ncbi:MAG: methyltransferase [Tannerella sp.]|jgi:uroporphyrinogen-III decarboxylase|nr:methyltransferase [Tannerella sp.]
MNSRERIKEALNHRTPDKLPIDFGSTSVTGIHCKMVEALREHYGLEKRPVRVIEPFQMLGEIDAELQEVMCVDCVPVFGSRNMFGIDETHLHEQVTPWGQKVLIAADIDLTTDANGEVLLYPAGDRSYPPSAKMPQKAFFIDAIERQTAVDDSTLDPADNLEEYGAITEEDLQFFISEVNKASVTGKAVIASFGGAALGDIAYIPGISLRNPKGIRRIAEWYMSTVIRQDYVYEVFEKQTDIAIANYSRLWDAVGDKVDVIFTCGTDFGTQESQFCPPETFRDLWLPHYKRLNDWVHQHTTWKVFKHSCGSMKPLLPCLIEAGFDIFNPVQINAADMDSQSLKEAFGDKLTFWGGGVDTQRILPHATPEEVRTHVLKQCETFGAGGGFVFNSVHNIQANVPVANVVAMVDTLREIRGLK